MLTYAVKEDFIQMKDIGRISATAQATGEAKIKAYLQRATRFINRFTRRDFIPWIEDRVYPPPYSYIDLAVRQFPSAHLKLDNDLLEALTVTSGTTVLDPENYFLLEHNIFPKYVIGINYPASWSVIGTSRYDNANITVNGMWGYFDNGYLRRNEAWIDTYEVLLSGGINSSQTTITLTNVDGEDAIGRTRLLEDTLIRVGDELMEIRSINTTTNVITVVRGSRGSTAVAHLAGVVVYRWRVLDDIVECTLQIAKAWRDQDISVGGSVGVTSGSSSSVEGSVPADALNMVKMYVRSFLMG